MITTIQLHKDVKESLRRLKQERETYEEVIIRLMKEQEKKQQEELLKEGYLAMNEPEAYEEFKEWDSFEL